MSGSTRNVYTVSQKGSGSALPEIPKRSRHFSGTIHRPSSILSGLRELMGRPRSESMGNADQKKFVRSPINRNLIRVQIESCPVEEVYDERDEDEFSDLYNDSLAFRRPRSNSSDFLILRKTSRPLSVDVVGLVDEQADPYKQYMKVVNCYELAPHNGAIVIVDKRLKLEKAFRAISECGVGAMLVWGQERRAESILTLTDFLIWLLKETTIASPTVEDAMTTNNLVTLPESSRLLLACEEFCLNRVHRIAVLEPSGDVLYLLTIKRILQAIHKQNRSLYFALWLSCEIKEAGIGTWSNIRSVKREDSMRKTVKMMLDYRLSSIPVVDDQMRPIDVVSKTDIAGALAGAPNIREAFDSCSMSEALENRNAPIFLDETERVGAVLDTLLTQKNCRCIFIKSSKDQCLIAAVSLSDFISFILQDKQHTITPAHSTRSAKT